jgi:hypothetical protein
MFLLDLRACSASAHPYPRALSGQNHTMPDSIGTADGMDSMEFIALFGQDRTGGGTGGVPPLCADSTRRPAEPPARAPLGLPDLNHDYGVSIHGAERKIIRSRHNGNRGPRLPPAKEMDRAAPGRPAARHGALVEKPGLAEAVVILVNPHAVETRRCAHAPSL